MPQSDDNGIYKIALSGDGFTIGMAANTIKKGDGYRRQASYVRVYQYNQKAKDWEEMGSKIVSDFQPKRSGADVSLALSTSGHVLAIGEPSYNTKTTMALNNNTSEAIQSLGLGRIRAFEFNKVNQTWSSLGNPIHGNTNSSQIGYSVALSDDGRRLVVGTQPSPFILSGPQDGSVQLYELNDNFTDWNISWQISGEVIGRRLKNTEVVMSGEGNSIGIAARAFDPQSNAVLIYRMDPDQKRR